MIEGTRIRPEFAHTLGQWEYIRCECLVKMPTRGGVFFTYQCEACGNTNLRFIHTLEHPETKQSISAGLECASVLADDYDVPQLAENETKRKERWRRHYRTPGRCQTTIGDLIEKGKL
jgi:hypothetical protein